MIVVGGRTSVLTRVTGVVASVNIALIEARNFRTIVRVVASPSLSAFSVVVVGVVSIPEVVEKVVLFPIVLPILFFAKLSPELRICEVRSAVIIARFTSLVGDVIT